MKTCKRGHELTESNLYRSSRGYAQCKTCSNMASRRFKATHRDPVTGLYIHAENAEKRAYYRDMRRFGGLRESVIQRDGEKCVACGMTRQEHKERYGIDITVDHIDGNGTFKPDHLKNNIESNLQTLCKTCHSSKDGRISGKVTGEDRDDVKMFYKAGISTTDIARVYGLTRSAVAKIVNQPVDYVYRKALL